MFAGRWSVEREQALKQLWDEGKLSASQIAKRIGGFEQAKDGGRSAILGKVHRLGLTPRKANFTPDELAQKREAQREAAKQRKREWKQVRRGQERVAAAVVKLIEVEQYQEEIKQSSLPFNDLRPFSQRRSNQCRFMLNDDAPFIACGAVTAPGESWCPHCREIVLRKPSPVLSDEDRFRHALAFKKNFRAGRASDTTIAQDKAA